MTLPAPTSIGPVSGYIPTGTRRYVFVPTVAAIATPTSAELTAGTDLTPVIAAIDGFAGSSNTVDFPNAASRWTPKIPGMIDAADSSFTINMSKTGADDAVDMFDDGSSGSAATSGYFAIFYEGITATGRLKLFPIQVTSCAASQDLGAASTVQVNVAITEPPSDWLTVPTA